MFDTPDTSQSAELTSQPAYGRDYGYSTPASQPPKKPRRTQLFFPETNLFERPVYTCPELGRTCFRPGAYDAFALPSLFGDERKPHRFQD